jgi:NADH pyrophosphatase NudC (nudix superfamily)
MSVLEITSGQNSSVVNENPKMTQYAIHKASQIQRPKNIQMLNNGSFYSTLTQTHKPSLSLGSLSQSINNKFCTSCGVKYKKNDDKFCGDCGKRRI